MRVCILWTLIVSLLQFTEDAKNLFLPLMFKNFPDFDCLVDVFRIQNTFLKLINNSLNISANSYRSHSFKSTPFVIYLIKLSISSPCWSLSEKLAENILIINIGHHNWEALRTFRSTSTSTFRLEGRVRQSSKRGPHLLNLHFSICQMTPLKTHQIELKWNVREGTDER